MNQVPYHATLTRAGLYSDHSDGAREQFLRACRNGELDIVSAYIELGLDLDGPATSLITKPLMAATEGAQLEVIDVLLEAGADLESRDSSHDTALMTACNWQHLRVVEHLLSRGADPNVQDQAGFGFVFKLVNQKKYDYLDAFLRPGAELGPITERGPSLSQYALFQNDAEALKIVLAHGADPNLRSTTSGQTLLMMAAKKERALNIVQMLVEGGAELNLEDHYGWTAFAIAEFDPKTAGIASWLASKGALTRDLSATRAAFDAAREGDLTTICRLVEHGLDLNLRDPHGETLLMTASANTQLASMAWLLENGIDKDALDNYGRSALVNAAHAYKSLNLENEEEDYKAHVESVLKQLSRAVRMLLDAGVEVNTEPDADGEVHDALEAAFELNDLQMLQSLVEAGADLSDLARCHTALMYGHLAIEERAPMLEYLHARGANLEFRSKLSGPAICVLAQKGDLTGVRTLVEVGVDIDTEHNGQTPLFSACSRSRTTNQEHARLVKFLLENGADYRRTHQGETPLKRARIMRSELLVEVFSEFFHAKLESAKRQTETEHPAPVDEAFWECFAASQDYETLLEWVRARRHELVAGLLAAGLSPNPSGVHHEHTLSVAADYDDLKMVELLLKYGANPNHPMSYGYTPLLMAVRAGNPELVKALLAAGGDPNLFNHWHRTPVTDAAEYSDLEMLQLLLDSGGTLNPLPVGYSPLITAVRRNHHEMVQWMLARGASPETLTEEQKTALDYALDNGNQQLASLLRTYCSSTS